MAVNQAYWMPYSANREFQKKSRIVTEAKGRYYFDDKNRKIFDGLSGLWTCGVGHSHPKITEAVSHQAATLDYAPSFQHAHPKIIQLAEHLLDFMPNDVPSKSPINRIFFTNSGSDACDTALKFARAYWRKKGMASKTKFIGRVRGYHGVNFGGISVGGIPANRIMFGQTLDGSHLSHTLLPENLFSKGSPEHGAHLADELLSHIMLYDASNIAAVIVEPVAGSTGVIPPPVGYLKRLREICDAHNILLIFDEVITAFGRMGSNTGAEEFGVVPDMMTMAKQITNGVIPMGAVAVQQHIYDTFMEHGGAEHNLEMPHGYTYSGHPIAAAAALATLDILEDEDMIGQVNSISPYFEQRVHELKGVDNLTDIRNYGLAAGLTFAAVGKEDMTKRPAEIAWKMWDKGFYVRYGGDTIQMGLPFTTTKDEIDLLINALGESIKESNQ